MICKQVNLGGRLHLPCTPGATKMEAQTAYLCTELHVYAISPPAHAPLENANAFFQKVVRVPEKSVHFFGCGGTF